jgi:antitoxin (DNA-binding transcriptional repressor) of toxin-antitoxin stability system
MKEIRSSVTEVARNFADCISRVHDQKASFILTENGKAVAKLTPEVQKVCTGRDLVEALSKVQTSTTATRPQNKKLYHPKKTVPK